MKLVEDLVVLILKVVLPCASVFSSALLSELMDELIILRQDLVDVI